MDVNDFNRLAPYYDKIAKLVFGKQLINVQTQFLDQIQTSDRLLILGGGSGEILKYVPLCKEIDYVEKSWKMINKASSISIESTTDFINEDFLTFSSEIHYDWIICPFFLDCFSEHKLKEVIEKIRLLLKPSGYLIISDFQHTDFNSWILKLMHLFFGVFANLESKSLQNINEITLSAGFKTVEEKFSYRNQLFSRLYRNL